MSTNEQIPLSRLRKGVAWFAVVGMIAAVQSRDPFIFLVIYFGYGLILASWSYVLSGNLWRDMMR